MFDEFAFRDIVRRRHKTLREVAERLGISAPTLYRKMSGISDFTRSEIQRLCDFLDIKDMKTIFFADEVS